MVERDHPALSIGAQCRLLSISRSSFCHEPAGETDQNLGLMRLQTTYLMADVELIATYKLFNISRSKLETLIHRIFAPVRLDIQIQDRFGRRVVPEEWFLVPFFAIDEAVEKIKDGTITQYVYDPECAALILR